MNLGRVFEGNPKFIKQIEINLIICPKRSEVKNWMFGVRQKRTTSLSFEVRLRRPFAGLLV